MSKGLAVGLLLGLFGTVALAKAQEESSKFDRYGGYCYARFGIHANLPGVAPWATYNGYGEAASSSTPPRTGSASWRIWLALERSAP
jgi:hypothetical protein